MAMLCRLSRGKARNDRRTLKAVKPALAVKQARKRARRTRVRAAYHVHRAVLGNRTSARRYSASVPELTAVEQRVVTELRDNGIALVSFEELVGDEGLWRELSLDMEAFAEDARHLDTVTGSVRRHKDDFLIRRFRRLTKERKKQGLHRPEPRLSPADAWLRFGLAVLNVANSYRGLWTKLIDLDNWYTVPFEGEHDRVGSQNWHRDPEDQHVLKVFLYFSDVDEDAGPFEYVPGSAPGGRYGHLWPWRVFGETYPSQDELARAIPESDRFTAIAPAGTVIFCDTSGFHRGGLATTKPRIMSYHTFVSPAAVLSGRDSRNFVVDPSPSGLGLPESAEFALT
jgi:hypothetical protein